MAPQLRTCLCYSLHSILQQKCSAKLFLQYHMHIRAGCIYVSRVHHEVGHCCKDVLEFQKTQIIHLCTVVFNPNMSVWPDFDMMTRLPANQRDFDIRVQFSQRVSKWIAVLSRYFSMQVGCSCRGSKHLYEDHSCA